MAMQLDLVPGFKDRLDHAVDRLLRAVSQSLRLHQTNAPDNSASFATHHHAAADGAVVLTDRTDVLTYRRFRTRFWVCGTFEVRDGRIVLWDDHFSMTNFVGAGVLGLVRSVLPR